MVKQQNSSITLSTSETLRLLNDLRRISYRLGINSDSNTVYFMLFRTEQIIDRNLTTYQD